jgi:hypothetical protein
MVRVPGSQPLFEIADRQGLRLPDDSQILLHELQEWLTYLRELCVFHSASHE